MQIFITAENRKFSSFFLTRESKKLRRIRFGQLMKYLRVEGALKLLFKPETGSGPFSHVLFMYRKLAIQKLRQTTSKSDPEKLWINIDSKRVLKRFFFLTNLGW